MIFSHHHECKCVSTIIFFPHSVSPAFCYYVSAIMFIFTQPCESERRKGWGRTEWDELWEGYGLNRKKWRNSLASLFKIRCSLFFLSYHPEGKTRVVWVISYQFCFLSFVVFNSGLTRRSMWKKGESRRFQRMSNRGGNWPNGTEKVRKRRDGKWRVWRGG